jgi:ATP-dependent protease HslVU (ClpYQ) peptidase subunit
MTCIVGIAHKGRVYLGGDSAGVSGLDLTVRADEKVFRHGEFAVGFTSSFRMGQILRYVFTPPEIRHDEDLMSYMVKRFIPEVRTVLKDEGYAHIENNREHGGFFLVGVRGRLFEIESDFQVGEATSGVAAVGCGYAYALGSMFAQSKAAPETRLQNALEAAANFSAGVVAPFRFVQIDPVKGGR